MKVAGVALLLKKCFMMIMRSWVNFQSLPSAVRSSQTRCSTPPKRGHRADNERVTMSRAGGGGQLQRQLKPRAKWIIQTAYQTQPPQTGMLHVCVCVCVCVHLKDKQKSNLQSLSLKSQRDLCIWPSSYLNGSINKVLLNCCWRMAVYLLVSTRHASITEATLILQLAKV